MVIKLKIAPDRILIWKLHLIYPDLEVPSDRVLILEIVSDRIPIWNLLDKVESTLPWEGIVRERWLADSVVESKNLILVSPLSSGRIQNYPEQLYRGNLNDRKLFFGQVFGRPKN